MWRSLFKFFPILLVCVGVGFSGSAFGLTVKLATIAPEGSEWMREMRTVSKTIKTRTEGRVTIKLYGGGVMGNDASMLRKIRIGQIHGGAFVTGALTAIYPDLYVYGLPMLFESQKEADYVRERMDQTLIDELELRGFVSFGLAGAGFAQFMSNIPIQGIQDMKGQKVWVPEGDKVSYKSMESLGLSPVTLPLTDVLTGLQTGLIDIIASSPVGSVVFQWHTKVKYVTTTPLVYVIATMIIDKRTFKKMSPADQLIVRTELAALYRKFDRQSIDDNASALNALIANGVKEIEPDAENLARWRQQLSTLADDLASDGLFSAKLLSQVRQHIDDFRKDQMQSRVESDSTQ